MARTDLFMEILFIGLAIFCILLVILGLAAYYANFSLVANGVTGFLVLIVVFAVAIAVIVGLSRR